MTRRDYVLALLVAIVWGANFTVIQLGLNGVPPMLLAALRFLLIAFLLSLTRATSWKFSNIVVKQMSAVSSA